MNLLVKGSYSVVFWHHPLEEDEWLFGDARLYSSKVYNTIIIP